MQKYFGLSYTEYIELIIDNCITSQDTKPDTDRFSGWDNDESPSVGNTHIVNGLTCDECDAGVSSLSCCQF